MTMDTKPGHNHQAHSPAHKGILLMGSVKDMFEFIFIDLTISLFIFITLLNIRISGFVLKAHERKIPLISLVL